MLYLYSTTHCHLCEQAEAILQQLALTHNLQWKVIEIADDEDLLIRYGQSIPVIHQTDTSIELSWPFNAEEIGKQFKLSFRQA